MVLLLRELFTIEQDFSADSARQEKGLRLLLEHPDRAAIMVARDSTGRAIGMVSGQIVISTAEGAPSVWIEDLVVAGPYRGHGLGRTLLQQAIQWAGSKGATRAQLLVDLDNHPALDFYTHLGWQATRLGMRRWRLEPPDSESKENGMPAICRAFRSR
ncbi:MAG: GNAT family N-acetyltransferase [Bacillota bacterium]